MSLRQTGSLRSSASKPIHISDGVAIGGVPTSLSQASNQSPMNNGSNDQKSPSTRSPTTGERNALAIALAIGSVLIVIFMLSLAAEFVSA